jgi:sec-independent protein translocase protein TatA
MQVAERSARIGVIQSSGVAIMGSFSLMHWIVVLAIILILFGAGKLPRVMGDFAKGIKAFKAGMKEEDEAETTTPAQVPPPGAAVSSAASASVADRPREHV